MNTKGQLNIFLLYLPYIFKYGTIILLSIILPLVIGHALGLGADSNGVAGTVYDSSGTAMQNFANSAYSEIEQAKQETQSVPLGWLFGSFEVFKQYWWVFLVIIFVVNWALKIFFKGKGVLGL